MQENERDQLQLEPFQYHPAVRSAAKVVSVVFHPLFIPVYIIAYLLYDTSVFPGFSAADKALILIRFLVMYTVFPLVTILLGKGLGFIESVYLKTQKDRIIPYIACGLYYFWMWYVLRNQSEFPDTLVMMALSIFIASSLGLILNSFVKISMHGLSVGVMSTFMYLLALSTDAHLGFAISISLLITGLVCTARLINTDHHPFEVYLGLFIGAISQLIAYWVV